MAIRSAFLLVGAVSVLVSLSTVLGQVSFNPGQPNPFNPGSTSLNSGLLSQFVQNCPMYNSDALASSGIQAYNQREGNYQTYIRSFMYYNPLLASNGGQPLIGANGQPIIGANGLPLLNNGLGNGINPATGLPFANTNGINPATGQPFTNTNGINPATGLPFANTNGINPATGQPFTNTNGINPATGLPFANTNGINPATGQPFTNTNGINPATGLPFTSTNTGINPQTGQPFTNTNGINPATGLPFTTTSGINPQTGQPFVSTNGINPATGLPFTSTSGINPQTGQPFINTNGINPATGQPFTSTSGINPATGLPFTNTNGINPATGQPFVGAQPIPNQPIVSNGQPNFATSVNGVPINNGLVPTNGVLGNGIAGGIGYVGRVWASGRLYSNEMYPFSQVYLGSNNAYQVPDAAMQDLGTNTEIHFVGAMYYRYAPLQQQNQQFANSFNNGINNGFTNNNGFNNGINNNGFNNGINNNGFNNGINNNGFNNGINGNFPNNNGLANSNPAGLASMQMQLIPGFPRPISSLGPGLPQQVDAAAQIHPQMFFLINDASKQGYFYSEFGQFAQTYNRFNPVNMQALLQDSIQSIRAAVNYQGNIWVMYRNLQGQMWMAKLFYNHPYQLSLVSRQPAVTTPNGQVGITTCAD